MNIVIRKASEADAEQIAKVHYNAWMETYRGILPETFLDARSIEKSTEIFKRSKCKNIVVASVDGKLTGFCGWGEFRGNECDSSFGEIHGIYVLKSYQRLSLGGKMINYALRELKVKGYKKAALWVLEENKNAVGFYEKSGFMRGMAKKNYTDGIIELLYVKEL